MNVRQALAFVVLGLAVCAPAAAGARAEPEDRILGTWEAVKSDLPTGTTLVFSRDGKLEVRIKGDKGPIRVDATWSVAGDRLTVQIRSNRTAEGREVARIVTLTASELTLKSDNGKVEEFKHIAPDPR